MFERAADSVGAARRRVSSLLAEVGRPDLTERATLAVSELATNALLYAGGNAWSVEIAVVDGALVVAVHDSSPAPPVMRAVDERSIGGRGLSLVAAVADSWGYDLTPDGKRVWCRWEPASA